MAVGAYTTALLTTQFEVSLIVGIIAGTLLSGLLGIIVGIPSLRLTGVFLAIATLGFGEIVRVFLINEEQITNGSLGISVITKLGIEVLTMMEGFEFNPQVLVFT